MTVLFLDREEASRFGQKTPDCKENDDVYDLWSIYWPDNNDTGGLHPSGLLRNPVVGKFSEGVGVLAGNDEVDRRPIRVCYTWSNIAANGACW